MQQQPASTGKSEVPVRANCFHCGETCEDEHIIFDQKDFCCNGCKTVYELLSDNDLYEYYDFQKHPGLSRRRKVEEEKYYFLDNDEIQKQLLDFSSAELNKVSLNVPQVHCSSCIWLLENLHRLESGILNSRVNFVRKELYVDYDPQKITLHQLVTLLTSIGYEPQINLDSREKKKSKQINQSLLLKIGVAGFAFGNIMLLSFTDYLGLNGELELQIRKFINYLNLILALPVVFYSGLDYFISAWQGLKKHFLNIDVPIALGILVLFLRSTYEIVTATGTGYFDSLAGLVFFLLIGRWFQSRTYENLSFERDYKAYFPLAVNRITNEGSEVVQVSQLKKGDRFFIRNQEIIPCDSTLISTNANLDYSFVTGESKTVAAVSGDFIYAGGRQEGPRIELTANKEVSQSYLTRLWNHDAFQKHKDLPQHRMVDQISKHFTLTIIFIAVATYVYWSFINMDIAFNSLTAVLIVACPCALSLSTPFTLGTTTRLFGRNKLYLKNAGIIEEMARIDHIVLDKTGTLSNNTGHTLVYHGNHPLSNTDKSIVNSITAHSTHPLSREINRFTAPGADKIKIEAFREINGKGLSAVVDGVKYKLGSKAFAAGEKINKNRSPNLLDELGDGVFLTRNNEIIGRFEHKSRFRDGLKEVFHSAQGFNFSLLSGDHDHEKEVLKGYLPQKTAYLFRQKPEDKLEYITRLQKNGEKVMMVGDGLNDAGALRQSDVGLAVTDNISAFSPASDGILDGVSLTRLFQFMDFSVIARKVIIASFIISFIYNIGGLAFAVTGTLTPVVAAILMPLSSITVVTFTTGAIHYFGKLKKLY